MTFSIKICIIEWNKQSVGEVQCSTRLFRVGPTKACKSFLFTDGTLKAENKEHLVDLCVAYCHVMLIYAI